MIHSCSINIWGRISSLSNNIINYSYYVIHRKQVQIVRQGPRGNEELVVAEIDLDLIRKVRDTWQFYRDRRPESYFELTDF